MPALTNAERQARHRAMRPLGWWATIWAVALDIPGPISDQTITVIARIHNRPADVVRREIEARARTPEQWEAQTVLVTDEDKGYDVIGPLDR